MYPDKINPYIILNISPNCNVYECKNAYRRLATNPDRKKRINANLAYDCLCNKDKYIQEGNYFRVKKKDCFYYTVVGDLASLIHYKELLKEIKIFFIKKIV